jgi:hypothetical protein
MLLILCDEVRLSEPAMLARMAVCIVGWLTAPGTILFLAAGDWRWPHAWVLPPRAHLLYAGAQRWLFGVPRRPGSRCGMIAVPLVGVGLAVRALREARRSALPGYDGDLKQVGFRPIPGIRRDAALSRVGWISSSAEALMEQTELSIIGAGPFGLALAAEARRLGIAHRVVGKAMAFWREHMPVGMVLRSGGDWHLDPAARDTIEAFLDARGLAPAEAETLSLAQYLD